MRLKNSYFYTLREDVKDEDSVSGNLLVKAGLIKKTSAGVYMMLPMGYKVEKKIEKIIRKHMEEAGAQEIRMPALIASDYYEKSGRLENFGPSIFRLKDRAGKNFVLGPTHEELFAVAGKMKIRSYKDLPFNLFQFQSKYRDEPRARFGLIRVKEFIMKDAYSFDKDENGLDISYKKMFDAYVKAFDEIGVDYLVVKADTGVMGGLLSEEFQAITDIGEDTIVYCDHCHYSSNLEIAKSKKLTEESNEDLKEKSLIATPNAGTIDEVCAFLNLPATDFVKTMIYELDNKFYAVMVKGDHEISETKLSKVVGAFEVKLAEGSDVERITNARVGFAGPIGLDIPVIVDEEVTKMHNFIVGANRSDYHYINVNMRDFSVFKVADITKVKDGDICPHCGATLKFTKGIEIGNTFKLGTKYSKALDLTYLDSDNTNQYVWMGSYGIGLGRVMAAVVEQNHDDKGIIWPRAIAPYDVAIVLISSKDDAQVKLADELYDRLRSAGIDVIYDDRDERPGVKFNDMELIGIPYRITVGKKASEGMVELKKRDEDEVKVMTPDEVIALLKD